MSKDQWIADVEAVFERYFDGEKDLSTAIDELKELGMVESHIRNELDPNGEVPNRFWRSAFKEKNG